MTQPRRKRRPGRGSEGDGGKRKPKASKRGPAARSLAGTRVGMRRKTRSARRRQLRRDIGLEEETMSGLQTRLEGLRRVVAEAVGGELVERYSRDNSFGIEMNRRLAKDAVRLLRGQGGANTGLLKGIVEPPYRSIAKVKQNIERAVKQAIDIFMGVRDVQFEDPASVKAAKEVYRILEKVIGDAIHAVGKDEYLSSGVDVGDAVREVAWFALTYFLALFAVRLKERGFYGTGHDLYGTDRGDGFVLSGVEWDFHDLDPIGALGSNSRAIESLSKRLRDEVERRK